VGRPPRPGSRGRGGPAGRRPSGPRGPRTGGPSEGRPAFSALKKREQAVVELPSNITVADLAIKLGVTPAAVIKELIGAGIFATMNQSVIR
jgi:hypothetical protein